MTSAADAGCCIIDTYSARLSVSHLLRCCTLQHNRITYRDYVPAACLQNHWTILAVYKRLTLYKVVVKMNVEKHCFMFRKIKTVKLFVNFLKPQRCKMILLIKPHNNAEAKKLCTHVFLRNST